jgi:hypothetical protein
MAAAAGELVGAIAAARVAEVEHTVPAPSRRGGGSAPGAPILGGHVAGFRGRSTSLICSLKPMTTSADRMAWTIAS